MVRICEHVGKRAEGGRGRQTLLVSATLTEKVLQMCEPWCASPRKIFVGTAPAEAVAAAAEDAAAAKAAAEAAAARRAAASAAAAAMAAAGGEGEGGEEGAAAVAAAAAAAALDAPRPSWGWGDSKSPSADAADYNPGTSSAGGLGSEEGAASSMPPHLQHHYIASAPQHKVDMLR
jgi:hypothetical protein